MMVSATCKAAELDRRDPLADKRAAFHIPDGITYLDGNSLGLQPKNVAARVQRLVETEWREHLITAWNRDGWIDLPQRLGNRIGRLIGAPEGTVRAGDSTSVNLFKVLSAALSLRGHRGVILSDTGNFPTDLYVAQGLAHAFPDVSLEVVPPEAVLKNIGPHVAVLMLTQVDYRTGRKHDMAALTKAAHEVGALVIWDLAHSAGAFPVDLGGCGADFAVGCTYKYLNGGPGAPAFFYVNDAHHEAIRPLLSGWFGHAAPFAFETEFRPAPGVDRMLSGTPPVLSMAALDAALDVWDEVDLPLVQEKSRALTGFFMERVGGFAKAHGLSLATPEFPTARGSQVSWRHENAYPVMQALIADGIIGDMRAPDYLRFGFAPLYTSFADVERAASSLERILKTRSWDQPQFYARQKVT